MRKEQRKNCLISDKKKKVSTSEDSEKTIAKKEYYKNYYLMRKTNKEPLKRGRKPLPPVPNFKITSGSFKIVFD
tara:strand:+ start:11747 stop:11968 length:222 start_codon:yes stop_codon:yes gene_type:complete